MNLESSYKAVLKELGAFLCEYGFSKQKSTYLRDFADCTCHIRFGKPRGTSDIETLCWGVQGLITYKILDPIFREDPSLLSSATADMGLDFYRPIPPATKRFDGWEITSHTNLEVLVAECKKSIVSGLQDLDRLSTNTAYVNDELHWIGKLPVSSLSINGLVKAASIARLSGMHDEYKVLEKAIHEHSQADTWFVRYHLKVVEKKFSEKE